MPIFSPLSREFLLERGYCCYNNCKNCPYNKMNVQQAGFVENQLSINQNLDVLAQKFYEKYGSTGYCLGPCDSFFENGRKVLVFSKFDGYDLKNEASRFLKKKL